MKKTCLLACAAGMACCSLALAKPPLEKLRPGAEIQPISIAHAKKVNGKIVKDGPWIPYTGGFGARNAPVNAPFYDCYGREPALAPAGSVGTNCVPACQSSVDSGLRWFFGSGYENPNTIEDMQDCACPPGSVISEVDLGFFWGATDNLFIIYFPIEEVLEFNGTDCTDPSTMTDTGGGGVILNYGVVPGSSTFYYYSRVPGLDAIGMLSPSTDDNGDAAGLADGSYQMIISDAVTSSAIFLAPGPCQSMLWGTGQTTGDCRPGLNNGDAFDDDAPTDGAFANPAECYDYTFGLCPDPLGKMNCFSYARCPADFNNDGFIDGSDSDSFNNAFEAGNPCADLNGDCFLDGSDSDLFNNEFESACP